MQPGWPDGLQFNCSVPLGMTQETEEEDKTALKALSQKSCTNTEATPHRKSHSCASLNLPNHKSDFKSYLKKQRKWLLFRCSRFYRAEKLYSTYTKYCVSILQPNINNKTLIKSGVMRVYVAGLKHKKNYDHLHLQPKQCHNDKDPSIGILFVNLYLFTIA